MKVLRVILALAAATAADAQHYCIPPHCSSPHAVVGKYTTAASRPVDCYDWFFRYLNNVVPGQHNNGSGYRNTTSDHGESIKEAFDSSSRDIFAMEANECGLTLGAVVNETRPMTPKEKALVARKQRLPTGGLHQCPCALQGRAHIIDATQHREQPARNSEPSAPSGAPMSKEEKEFIAKGGVNGIFGVHAVMCAFHSSGPCLLDQIERGVSRLWAGNFSHGYHPLMDNNLMLWTPTLGPILDLFHKDGVEFYPMRWFAPTEDGHTEVFSVLVSPCGKVLYEIAAPEAGGRARDLFHAMPMSRAVLREWNEPAGQPLVPLRFAHAVPVRLMDQMLEFYGATGSADAKALGFETTVLLDETGDDGSRAVTLKLSGSASVHLQLWAVPQPDGIKADFEGWVEPWHPGPGGFEGDFAEARNINQVTGAPVEAAADFCQSGTWSVDIYSWYMLHTHKATLAPVPSNTSTLSPPMGEPMNIFLDDHISWDCISDECELAAGSRALFNAGSHLTYVPYKDSITEGKTFWWPYSHDPAGYGVQLHWFNQVTGFQPEGKIPLACFRGLPDGTCEGASAPEEPLLVV